MDKPSELIQLNITPKQFDLLMGAMLSVTAQAVNQPMQSIVSTALTIRAIRNDPDNARDLMDMMGKLNDAKIAQHVEERCSNPDCPVHGDSEQAEKLRTALGIQKQ